MRLRVFVWVLALLVACPAGAFAAMVTPKSGEVRIGTGQGFQAIAGPTEAAAGAQIMVGPEGAALIAYSQTCVVRAPPAAITIVEDHAPCASMPKPSYFGFAQSNEMGVAITSDAFGFTPKVDAPDTSETPEKSQAPQSQAPQSQAPQKSQAPQEF